MSVLLGSARRCPWPPVPVPASNPLGSPAALAPPRTHAYGRQQCSSVVSAVREGRCARQRKCASLLQPANHALHRACASRGVAPLVRRACVKLGSVGRPETQTGVASCFAFFCCACTRSNVACVSRKHRRSLGMLTCPAVPGDARGARANARARPYGECRGRGALLKRPPHLPPPPLTL